MNLIIRLSIFKLLTSNHIDIITCILYSSEYQLYTHFVNKKENILYLTNKIYFKNFLNARCSTRFDKWCYNKYLVICSQWFSIRDVCSQCFSIWDKIFQCKFHGQSKL